MNINYFDLDHSNDREKELQTDEFSQNFLNFLEIKTIF